MDATRMEPNDVQEELEVPPETMEPSEEGGANESTPAGETSGRKWLWVGIAVAVLVVGGIAIAVLATNGTGDDSASELTLSTATVQRTDLVVTEELPGTLGYGAADPMTFRSSDDGVMTIPGLLTGTVTAIVAEGTVVEFGDVLYEVNTDPVVVLPGTLPAYRAFNTRMSDGPDVEQLEQALVDLGYDPNRNMTINEDFTSATADAIERLQEDIGADEDGSLNLGEVIFMADAFYVAEPLVDVGTTVGNGSPIVATSSAIEGTVTTIIDEGSIAGLGEELMTIDGEPVVLLIGDVPVFRAMGLGVSGADVLQLEAALVELGYGDADDFTADGVFDEASRLAVVAWQAAIGAQPDGVVNVGDVIFLPNPIRVGDNLVAVGDVVRDGTPIISTSVSATFVTVELSTNDQDLVAVGDAVVVVLPNGTREPASVTEIGTVVQANQGGDTFFEMTVTLDDPDAAPGLDEAPVDVEIIGDSAANVLAVPVTALIALAEGGYAVEIVAEDGTTFLVAVDPGLFADGAVEVASDGLQPGLLVVIP